MLKNFLTENGKPMSKSVLVTGSGKGIGKAIAMKLASEGYELIVHYRTDIKSAQETCGFISDSGGKCRMLQFDISDRKSTGKKLIADIEANGIYYGVVCNAGINRDAAFPAMTGEEWDSVIHTNLDGFYNVLQPLVMPMIHAKRPGRIVTLSSLSGLIGNRGQVNYSAAKAGIIAATKALAVELAKRKITVNCIAPGLIKSDMAKDAPLDEILKVIPVRRLGKPEEVAAAVSFLLSEGAAYITRQVISVNGGIF
jgi:3-oxoacyl-[acyl-carrier protein] reductase